MSGCFTVYFLARTCLFDAWPRRLSRQAKQTSVLGVVCCRFLWTTSTALGDTCRRWAMACFRIYYVQHTHGCWALIEHGIKWSWLIPSTPDGPFPIYGSVLVRYSVMYTTDVPIICKYILSRLFLGFDGEQLGTAVCYIYNI